jgi:CRISPR/Cas system type I-B associated protein Csh2 (Cas7 group RAMP superfamily)
VVIIEENYKHLEVRNGSELSDKNAGIHEMCQKSCCDVWLCFNSFTAVIQVTERNLVKISTSSMKQKEKNSVGR